MPIINFYQRIFFSVEGRVGIGANFLLLYCSNKMIVSIWCQFFCNFSVVIKWLWVYQGGGLDTQRSQSLDPRWLFGHTFLINDKSDNPASVSLVFGLCADIFIERDEVIQTKWTSQLNIKQSQLRIVFFRALPERAEKWRLDNIKWVIHFPKKLTN